MALLGREDKPVKLKSGTFLGKGSKQRPIRDRKKFEENWDAIQRDAEFPPGMSSAVKNYVLKQEQQNS